MIKVAIIGYGNRGKSALNEYLKSHYKEEEVTYLNNIVQLTNKVREDSEDIIDLSNLKIIIPDSIEDLSTKLNFSLNQHSIEYIREDDFLVRYVESPKEKYDKDKLKRDNYKSKQKIRSYKR